MTTSKNPLQELQELGQSVWLDNIRRGIITSGELQRLISIGVTGLTSNPTIFEKAIAGSNDYDDALVRLSKEDMRVEDIYNTLVVEDIQAAADVLRPVYDRTGGLDGFASLEPSPHLAHDAQGTIEEVRRKFAKLDRPNVMVKVPATPEGIVAIEKLIGEGININVTLIFSLEAYGDVREAYVSGLESYAAAGGDISKVRSVASFFVSRVDTAVDNQLKELVENGRDDLRDLESKAAIANAKLAYQSFKDTFGNERFAALQAHGAKVQRPLWASTSTKNPVLSDVLYVENLIGKDTVNTMPEVTMTAFLEHGSAIDAIEDGVDEARATIQALEDAGISMEQVTSKLLADGVKAFAVSYDQLLENIEDKKARLMARQHVHDGTSLANHLSEVESTIDDLQKNDVVARIWRKDHTVWKDDPTEITNRLGWLTITDLMDDQIDNLKAFAEQVKNEGYKHVVLLGMGGSSLGPEVLRQAFGSAEGYPELIVLDSTVPAWVQAVDDAIDPAKTMFIVSSKSGGTVEPNVFYKHFRNLVEDAVGKEQAGKNFVAVTDPGSDLETLGKNGGFRRVFANPTDMGGRYSVLSYFGLVPAALIGMDIPKLIDRADRAREGCASVVAAHDNAGAWLGAIMGTLAQKGRDKLTLATSPSIASFGLWVEQLIAESTGKEGKGIVPIAGEPLLGPDAYGDDRLFVYLRLEGDDNAATDSAIEKLASANQPVVRLDMADIYDIGGEFYRWEFAIPVAGALLQINPFDQPNVEDAKELARSAIQNYQKSKKAPVLENTSTLSELLSKASAGDYLAIMGYVNETPESDDALTDLRRRVMEKHKIATTLGYGPRFLHSTGQLHKGGPNNGLYLQITSGHDKDIPIPGESYTFGILADAQAVGDYSALETEKRRAARIHLKSGQASEIKDAVKDIG